MFSKAIVADSRVLLMPLRSTQPFFRCVACLSVLRWAPAVGLPFRTACAGRPHPPDLATLPPPDARCSPAMATLLRSKRNSRGEKKPDALTQYQLNQPPVRSHAVQECCFGPAAVFPLVFFAPPISTFHQRNLIRAFADLQCFPSLLSNRPPASGCGAWSTSTTSSALCTSASGSERTFKPCCRVLVGLLPILAYA